DHPLSPRTTSTADAAKLRALPPAPCRFRTADPWLPPRRRPGSRDAASRHPAGPDRAVVLRQQRGHPGFAPTGDPGWGAIPTDLAKGDLHAGIAAATAGPRLRPGDGAGGLSRAYDPGGCHPGG